MLETKDLLLDKAKFSDWKSMYKNVWSRTVCAKYMRWSVTTNELDAQERMRRTIEFQRTHDTYLVYERCTGEAIGFAGVERVNEDTFTEMGICIGADYQGKGYGRQVLRCLIDYCRERFGVKRFLYSARANNAASVGLVLAFGFTLESCEDKIDDRDGTSYVTQNYSLTFE